MMEYRLAGVLVYVEVFKGRGGSVSTSGQGKHSLAHGYGWYLESGAKAEALGARPITRLTRSLQP